MQIQTKTFVNAKPSWTQMKKVQQSKQNPMWTSPNLLKKGANYNVKDFICAIGLLKPLHAHYVLEDDIGKFKMYAIET